MLYIAAGVLAGGPMLFALACRCFPGLADGWMETVFAPVASALASLSGKCVFPVAEPLALLLVALLVFLLFRSRRGACLLLSGIVAGYALFWAPAYFVSERYAVDGHVESGTLTAVCGELIERLNAYGTFALPDDLCERALEVASLSDTPAPLTAAPKYARYPEWMRALSLAGLYVPWTFEAVVNPDEAEAGRPFTAVHELMHMGGVADEGQANIYAYVACQQAGGAFAYSSDLWALQYAMAALGELDGAAWNDCLSRLSESVRADFFAIGGGAPPSAANGGAVEAFLRLGGISEKTANYGALAVWLCNAYCMNA